MAGATFDEAALPIGTSTTTFGVKVSGVAEGVCKQLASMSGGKARVRKQDALASELTAASCDDSNALAFVFGDDELTNSGSSVDSNSTGSGSSLDSGSDSGSCSGSDSNSNSGSDSGSDSGACSGSGSCSESCEHGAIKCENGSYYECDSGEWNRQTYNDINCDGNSLSSCNNGDERCVDGRYYMCSGSLWELTGRC